MASDEPTPYSEGERFSEEECVALFERMFPHGFEGEDVLRELAPDGWERSPFLAVFHPSVERLHEEAVRIHRNFDQLAPPEKRGGSPEPTLESIRAEHQERPVDPEKECRELVAMCLWDIFSDNHEVLDADGRVADLGSFRGSAGFLADFLNRRLPNGPPRPDRPSLADLAGMAGIPDPSVLAPFFSSSGPYDYMDFYMGTIWVHGRADFEPVYELIFRRIRAQGLDWVYDFPRLNVVDLRPLRDALKKPGEEPEWASYDPSAAMAKEQEEAARDAEIEHLREDMDQAYRESAAKAAAGPPPDTVAAYRRVYGHFPRGWPPAV